MVLGNSKLWSRMSWGGSLVIDTLWRSTPIILWKKILNVIFGTYDEVNMGDYATGGAPCEGLNERDNKEAKYDDLGDHGISTDMVGSIENETNTDSPEQKQCGKAELAGYRVGRKGDCQEEGEVRSGGSLPHPHRAEMGNVNQDTRRGDLMIADPEEIPPACSGNPIILQCAINRFWEFKDQRPFTNWETLSDTADSTYEEYVTGNSIARNLSICGVSTCGGCLGGPYYAPNQHEWDSQQRTGGEKGMSETSKVETVHEFTPELIKTLRRALHFGPY